MGRLSVGLTFREVARIVSGVPTRNDPPASLACTAEAPRSTGSTSKTVPAPPC